MRTNHWSVRVIALAIGVALAAPLSARAEEEPSQISSLEQRLMALEDRLATSEATVASQRKVITAANLDSALARDESNKSFWDGVVTGGHVAVSYGFNFNNPNPGTALAQPLYTFNQRHSEFRLDAAKIEIGKPTEGPGTAGFQFDMLYGQNADILRVLSTTATPATQTDDELSTFVQQAYVAYNLNGVELIMGRWQTILGYEVLDSLENPNVTHGLLTQWLQPFFHTGVLASGQLTENLSWAAGVANGFNNSTENNDQKAALGQLAFESGNFFTSLSGYYGFDNQSGVGADAVTSSDPNYILDVVATLQVTDALGLWLNADLGEAEDGDPTGGDAQYWGVSVGGKMQLSDATYFAVRYDYLEDDEGVRGLGGAGPGLEASSITGTLGHQLTDRLLIRAEVRYDEVDDDLAGGAVFPDDSATGFGDDEVFGIVEAVFSLD